MALEGLSPERLARLERLADEMDIRDCLARFSRGMDRFDRDIYRSAFHPDAETAAGPFVGNSWDCYEWAMPMHAAGQILTHHALLNITIAIADDTAHTETYYLFVARNHDESVWMAGGRYVDRLERRDGEWKIALRTNFIEWSCTPPAMPIPFADVPGIDGNGTSARDTSDPSYARPLINHRAPSAPG